ncbi:MAG: TfoX/Sxy family protein [Vulcanimicrobiaceae bacterium]
MPAAATRNDEKTAARIRRILSSQRDVVEIRMFGGLCFMVNGSMCCGINKDALLIRVGAAARKSALAQPGTRPMTMRGKPLGAFIYVDPDGYRTEAALAKWVQPHRRDDRPVPPPSARWLRIWRVNPVPANGGACRKLSLRFRRVRGTRRGGGVRGVRSFRRSRTVD